MKPTTMKLVARVLLALIAAFMLLSGLNFMFNPAGALPGLMVTAEGAEGLSNVRAFLGGAITAIGISVIFAVVTADINNARPAVLFTFALVVGRITGVVVDGMFDRAILYTAVPVIVFLVLLTAHKLLDKVEAAEKAKA